MRLCRDPYFILRLLLRTSAAAIAERGDRCEIPGIVVKFIIPLLPWKLDCILIRLLDATNFFNLPSPQTSSSHPASLPSVDSFAILLQLYLHAQQLALNWLSRAPSSQ